MTDDQTDFADRLKRIYKHNYINKSQPSVLKSFYYTRQQCLIFELELHVIALAVHQAFWSFLCSCCRPLPRSPQETEKQPHKSEPSVNRATSPWEREAKRRCWQRKRRKPVIQSFAMSCSSLSGKPRSATRRASSGRTTTSLTPSGESHNRRT